MKKVEFFNFSNAVGGNVISAEEITRAKELSDKVLLPEFFDETSFNFFKEFSKDFENLFVIGTGGSSLCGNLLTNLKLGYNEGKRVFYLDNPDPNSIALIFKKGIDLKKSLFLSISKSGATIETLAITSLLLDKVSKAGIEPKNNFLFISTIEGGHQSNFLNIAKKFDIKVVNHRATSGRFSNFHEVSLYPALFLNLDIKSYFNSAEKFFNNLENQTDLITLANNLLAEQGKKSSLVFMPYADALGGLTEWFSQILAESLGKNGNFISPIKAHGTIDQHSQLQLYLDGPNDKIHLITLVENFADDEKINIEIEGKTLNIEIGKVLYSSGVATASVLERNKIPLIKIALQEINEEIIGEFVAFYTSLILVLAAHLKLNPFDQPRVEDGKKICVEILKN